MRLSTRVSASTLCLVISFLLAHPASAATVGNMSVFPQITQHATRRAQPFVMPQSGRITSVTIYHGGGTGRMRLAVYGGTATAPQTLLGRTVNTPVRATPGWQTVPLEGPVFAAGGSTVW